MIEAKGLTKKYGNVTALDKVSFEVRKGEVLGFLGPNGAGKTTAMKILTCFIAPTEGTAKVNGCDVFDDPMGVRTSIGYLPEANPLYVDMLVLEYLEWIAQMRGLSGQEARRQIRKIVEETALTEVIGREISELSKGFRQRVGLAAALMHEPPILILDEPMSGLDPNQATEIRELIKEIGTERTVIFSTHNLAEVQLTCNRVLIVSEGRIVADDTPDELRARKGKPRFMVSLADVVRQEGYKNPEDVLKAVSGVDRVNEIAGSPRGEVHLEVLGRGGEDLRPELVRALKEADLPLLELWRQHENLETVFRELTLGKEASRADSRKKKRAAKKAEAKKAQERDEADEAGPKNEGADAKSEGSNGSSDDDSSDNKEKAEAKDSAKPSEEAPVQPKEGA